METYKERLFQLIEERVPEVNEIYTGTLTVCQRILLWDFIENIKWIDMCHETSEEVLQRCYEGFIEDISHFIEAEENPLQQVDLECLKKKLLNHQFMKRPRDFMIEMAEMVQKEDALIEKYSINEMKELSVIPEDDVIQTLDESAMQIKIKLSESLSAEKQILDVCGVHGPNGQLMLNQMKVKSTQICEDCKILLLNFFRNKETVINFLKKAKKTFQKKMFFDSVNLPMSENALSLNALDKNFQTLTAALLSIKEDMEMYKDNMIRLSKQSKDKLQSDLYLNLKEYENKWEDYLQTYLQLCVVTVKPPANQYQKSSTTSTKKLEPETTGKKVSESQKDKIENSDLNSTLKLLGARSFGHNFKINPESCLVLLVDERKLPETVLEGTDLKLSSDHNQLCGMLQPDTPPKLVGNTELTFYRTSLSDLTRTSKSKSKASARSDDSTSFVCANFARFCYQINIEFLNRKTTLHAVSQPIGLRTGSAQLLPFHGSLTWYAWSVDNVYETLRNPQKLPVVDVLNMLDALISTIQEEAFEGSKPKYRPLSANEKTFLLKKMLGNSLSETVNLTDFICVKPGDSKRKHAGGASQMKKDKILDFHTWFFALLESLNGFLKGLWLDRIIYEICSWEETSKVLQRKTTPNGTIILRPSNSKIQNPKCMKPSLDLILEIKDAHGNHQHINWEAKYIKHLPGALIDGGIGFSSMDLKIQGVNHRYPVSTLQIYFSNDETFYYRRTTFKVNMSIEIISSNQNSSGPGCVSQKKTKVKDTTTADQFAAKENSPCNHKCPETMFLESSLGTLSPSSCESVDTHPSLILTEITPDSSLMEYMEQGGQKIAALFLPSENMGDNGALSRGNHDLRPLIPDIFPNGDQLEDYLENELKLEPKTATSPMDGSSPY